MRNLIEDNKLKQISVDQTYATYLVHEKKITPEEAAGQIQRVSEETIR